MFPKISPHDIASPIGMNIDQYREVCDTGNPLEASIYATIINNSQNKGKWTPTNHFPKMYERVIFQMESRGSLVKISEKEGFLISGKKAEQLQNIKNNQ